jgi:hypothetical protein
MSRWNAQFKNHPFQQIWSDLKLNLDEAKVDDKSVHTSVEEMARLKKVIAFINGLLSNVDPELVPPTIWDSFQQQVAECFSHVKNYNQTRNIAYIQNANANADNLLNYVRPYVVAHGKAAKAASEAYKTYIDEIEQYTKSFLIKSNEIITGITEANETVSEKLEAVVSKASSIDEAFIEICGEEGKQGKFNSQIGDFKKKYSEFESYYTRLFEESAGEESLIKQIDDAKEEIDGNVIEIIQTNKKIVGIVSELKDAHEKVFGVLDADGMPAGGLKEEYTNNSIKYKALNDKVEALLPGATSAALASSYNEMKISFDGPIRNSTRLFYGSISLLVLVSFILSVKVTISPYSFEFIAPSNWLAVMQSLVSKLPIYGPLVWLAYYASKRRSEYQRLQQEYSHKEALATSFESYKKQILELGEKDNPLLAHLLQKAVDAVAYNASESLDKKHGDKMPLQEVVEKAVDGVIKSKELFSFHSSK